MIALACCKCGGSFLVKPYRANKAKFCSYDCYWGKSEDVGQKSCSVCRQDKSVNCFQKVNRGWDSRCKDCKNKQRKNYRRRNYAGDRYAFYRWNAKRSGRDFGISLDEYKKLVVCGRCHYCGRNELRLGLDRVDSKHGYTIGNIVPCCRQCNIAKNDKSVDEFIEMCILVAKKYGTS